MVNKIFCNQRDKPDHSCKPVLKPRVNNSACPPSKFVPPIFSIQAPVLDLLRRWVMTSRRNLILESLINDQLSAHYHIIMMSGNYLMECHSDIQVVKLQRSQVDYSSFVILKYFRKISCWWEEWIFWKSFFLCKFSWPSKISFQSTMTLHKLMPFIEPNISAKVIILGF